MQSFLHFILPMYRTTTDFLKAIILPIFLISFFSLSLQAQLCNRIEFHDFEEGNIQLGWNSTDGVNGTPSGLSQTDSAVISGNFAAKLEVNGNGASMNNRPRTFSLTAGKFYELSFFARSSDTSRVYFGILRDSTFIPVLLDSVFTLPFWQEVSVEFQAPEDWPNAVLVFSPSYFAQRGPYDFFLDFVTLCEKEATDTCNLATLGSFESLAFSSVWSHFDGGDPGSSFLFLENENVYDRRFCAELKVNYFGGSGAFITTSTRAMFPVDSASYYTLTCWMRSDVDSARVEALVNRRTPYRELGTQFFILDTVWRKYSMTFRSDVTDNQAYIRFIAKNAYLTDPYSVYIDDVRLCGTEEPPRVSPGGVERGLIYWANANFGPNARAVATWFDISGSENHVSQSGTAPTRKLESVNLNEAVDFNTANERLVGASLDLSGLANRHAWFVVLKGNNPAASATPVAFMENGYRLEAASPTMWQVEGIQPTQSAQIPTDVNQWSILSANSNVSNYRLFLNGANVANLNPLSGLDAGDSTILGAKAVDNSNWFNGEIAEVLVYENNLNNAERNSILSYLSLKFGIAIPVNQHRFYNHNSHPNQLAGIGQERALMGFTQTKSRNVSPGSIVSISRPSRMDDGDYLVWGHNNASLSNGGTVPAGVNSRILRNWRVSHTGDLGKVTVSFDLEELGLSPGYTYAVLVDDDGNFSNAKVYTQAFLNENEIGFPGVRLEDGDYFTIGQVPQGAIPKAPGRLDDGLTLWLQAELGPNSNSLSTWDDLSPHGNTATAFDEGPRREWDQINGNPAIDFTIFRNLMIGSSELYLKPDKHSYYIVLNSANSLNWRNPFTAKESGYRLEVNGNTRNYSVYGLEPGGINATSPSGDWSMIEISSAPDGYQIFENGVENSSRTVRDGLLGEGPYFVGARNRRYSAWYTGKIAELIVYGKEQDPMSRNAIETYLSIKYGLTIPVSAHLYYNQTSHDKAIAGIGKDSQQHLLQDNSMSIDTSAILRINNPSDLGDQEYLVWGHEGANLERNPNVPPGENMRFNRTWRISRTGSPGLVWVEFELAGLGLDLTDETEFALLIDTDKDFSDAKVRKDGVLVGSRIQFQGVEFNDGDLFSLSIADDMTISVENLPSELLEWKLYPNPGTEQLNIEVETAQAARLGVEVYDFQGRKIYEKDLKQYASLQEMHISTTNWPVGFYVVRLREGTASVSRTWIKQ
ncbi:MAG: LamG-like jellyroll fold domain-containing protein [Bacteroidota bacterium]